jgi:fluoroquinolone transport system ATP-binding protein
MIQVTNLTFTYPGGQKPAVKSVNFSIQAGEIFGFLGPNGAGKSTTQRILIGLLKGYSGQVEILNKSVPIWGKELYEHIGVGFEVPNFYSKLTAQENLEFFGAFYQKSIANPLDLLRSVGLNNDAKKKVGEYSKGMKVRLNFLRAIQHDPEILFLDEPTSGLDPLSRRIICDLILKKKAEGKTIFLTTHNMKDAEELCDRVAFIVEGQIKMIEKPKELQLQAGQKTVKVGIRANGDLQYSIFPIKGLATNADFLKFLQNHEIESIHSQEATLDEIFIKVTGAHL